MNWPLIETPSCIEAQSLRAVSRRSRSKYGEILVPREPFGYGARTNRLVEHPKIRPKNVSGLIPNR